MSASLVVTALVGLVALVGTGCESSQDLSAKLQKEGARVIASQHGLVIRAINPYVRVVQTGVVTDPNGTAVAVIVRNIRPTPLAAVPIAIDVLGSGGKSVFRNNTPGLESSLVAVPELPPGREFAWVDDQVIPTGRALSVQAKIGVAGQGAPATPPRIVVGAPHVTNDPQSGLEAVGTIANRSKITQLKLFVYVVAWRGRKLVSAGRGAIAQLAGGAHTKYHVYLIGNPGGARLTVEAPPTVLR
jgi:hypothetical protein